MGVCSQEGRRVISFCFPPGLPTKAVRICGSRDGWEGVVKSKREGPELRRSVKDVSRRRGGVVDVGLGSLGSKTAVAKERWV